MNTTLDTLDRQLADSLKFLTRLQTLLRHTNNQIAKGNVPAQSPSSIIAQIEHCQGFMTGLNLAIRLLNEQEQN